MLVSFIACSLASALLTGLLQYWLAHQQMLDRPGARRLHRLPTARGGGLAIVLVVATYLSFRIVVDGSWRHDGLLGGGLLAVAAVGWRDDQSSLGIWPRLLVHAIAGALIALLVLDLVQVGQPLRPALWLLLPLIAFSVVASINLHNFMDGANGMLATQSLFVFGMLLVWLKADSALALLALVSLAAVLGFLPFNFPRARVFLGDVGSGTLGYLIIALCWWALAGGQISVAEVLLLNSLFLIDAVGTLGLRMVRRKRWWRAHHEHLYQWLVRSGSSHLGVVVAYQLFNLLLILPILWALRQVDADVATADCMVGSIRLGSPLAFVALASVLALGLGCWFWLKRVCLGRLRAQ